MLSLQSFVSAEAFLDAARSFLENRESENGLILSAALLARKRPGVPGWRWLIGARADEIQAAGLLLADGRIALSHVAKESEAREFGKKARERLELSDLAMNKLGLIVIGPEPTVSGFVETWTEAPCPEPELKQNLMVLRLTPAEDESSRQDSLPPFKLAKATSEHLPLLRKWMRDFDRETGALPSQPPAEEWIRLAVPRGDAYVWADSDGHPLATASVGGRTRRGARIHLVYVPPERRRNGFAEDAIDALAGVLRKEGKEEASLFVDTKAGAIAAQSLYHKMGFSEVATFLQVGLKSNSLAP